MKLLIAVLCVGVMVAPAAASWDHPIKWNQLDPWGEGTCPPYLIKSTYTLTGFEYQCADDWLCDETGWITDIHLRGDSMGTLDRFRVTFYDDVPATASEESHPGNLLHEVFVDPEDLDGGIMGWTEVEDDLYSINLPQDDWFPQEAGNIYWVSTEIIQRLKPENLK